MKDTVCCSRCLLSENLCSVPSGIEGDDVVRAQCVGADSVLRQAEHSV